MLTDRLAPLQRYRFIHPGADQRAPEKGGRMPNIYGELAASVAAARERFLAVGEAVAGSVREPILNSWRRSRSWGVDADRLASPYRDDAVVDNHLVHGAAPVLDRLERELADAPMTVVLADPGAWVLDRRGGDSSLLRKLDNVSMAPGFCYAERYVGTNGIGTALEEQAATSVFGCEHFSGRLQSLSCAGAVIRNPLRGRTEGVLDLTCWRGDASPLMRVLVQEAARDVSRRLGELEGERERVLLQEFMAACRRTPNPILSLNHDLVISNTRGVKLLGAGDHVALRERAAELLRTPSSGTADLRLPSGGSVRLRCRPVGSGAGPAGAVLEIETLERGPRRRSSPVARALPLAGLAGSSPAWLQACAEAISACERRIPLVLVGESGAGKLALARAVHRRWAPAERLRVIDGPGGRELGAWIEGVRMELAQPAGTIVLRRVDRLEPAAAEALAGELRRRGDDGAWVVATAASQDAHPALVERFAGPVGVPPLRYRIEDLPELVPYLLDRLAQGTAVRCGPEALQVLLHNQWPGNVEQLESALRTALGRCRAGLIAVADLPVECRSVTRQVLTRWQWIERDAIVDALAEAKGNRARAAAKLGISRATIYRRINSFGISLAGLHD
jgi:transcriptional regulator of acetoin/glycerol metabolism